MAAGSNTIEGMEFHLLCLLTVGQVEVSAISYSLIQRSPTGCVFMCLGVSNCV